jgi:hypothetical protein
LTDPVFVTLAKSLYGDDVELEDIQRDVFGKGEPDQADVHVPGGPKRKKRKEDQTEDVMVNDPAEVGKLLAEAVAKGEMTNTKALEIAKSFGHKIKRHIKSGHSGSYGSCVQCKYDTESTVAKDWASYDAERKSGHHTRNALLLAGGAGAANATKFGADVAGRAAKGELFWHKGTMAAGRLNEVTDAAKTTKLTRQINAARKVKRAGKVGTEVLAAGAAIEGGRALYHHLKKNDDSHEVTWEGEFSKVDDDKRQVFGWASVTEIDGKPVVDLQGDYIHPTEMERAAYDYVIKSRKGGDMHSRVDDQGNLISKDAPLHVSDMIESMVFTPEKVAKLGLPEGSLPTGWWVGFKVNDEPTWELVKSGERKGFSIHGLGARLEKRLEEIDPTAEIVGKAYEVSANTNEFKKNLETIAEVTGEEFYKHLAHGIQTQMNDVTNNTRNEVVGAGLGGAIGGHAGALAGIASRKGGEAPRVGSAIGGLVGAAVGAGVGHHLSKPSRPVRPPIVEAHLGPRMETKAARLVEKAVSTANRSGSVAHRQNAYTEQAMQQATQALAPQVAQHIQMMQQQKWQQMQMEQQMLQQQAGGQQPQNWMTTGQQGAQQPGMPPMGPYDMNEPTNGGVTPNQGPKQRTL